MPKPKYAAYEPAAPYFDLVRGALGNLVDGEHFFDVVTDDPYFSRKFYREALSRELLLRPIGTTVYFMPPYTISNRECEFLVKRAAESLEAALK